MSRRLLVDADALGRVVAAATDPLELRQALAALVAAGIGAPAARPWLSVDEAARALGVPSGPSDGKPTPGRCPANGWADAC